MLTFIFNSVKGNLATLRRQNILYKYSPEYQICKLSFPYFERKLINVHQGVENSSSYLAPRVEKIFSTLGAITEGRKDLFHPWW